MIAQPPGLIAGGLAAFAEAIHHLAQDRGNGVADLIARCSRGIGGLTPGNAADLLEFRLDSAQMLLDGGNAGSEIRCAILEHAASRNLWVAVKTAASSSHQLVNDGVGSGLDASGQ